MASGAKNAKARSAVNRTKTYTHSSAMGFGRTTTRRHEGPGFTIEDTKVAHERPTQKIITGSSRNSAPSRDNNTYAKSKSGAKNQ